MDCNVIKNVAIVGGTHGNELTGINLIKHWENEPKLTNRESFNKQLVIANPLAVRKKIRFVDEDLNRKFHIDQLNSPPADTWESHRANELNRLLGPKLDKPKTDFIIDLHTTTAEMGPTLIIYDNPFNLKLAAYVQSHSKDVQIYLSDKKYEDTAGLQSIAPHSILLELGPVSQNVLMHSIYKTMEKLVHLILDFIDKSNSDSAFDSSADREIEVFRRGDIIEYPTDKNGNPTAMVHEAFQSKNFRKLKKGDPLFVKFNGEIIRYEGDKEGYPVFINEAAYYEKNMALRLNFKETIKLSANS